jgi:hypothetical protein
MHPSNVFGPISREDWVTLLMFKKSIANLKAQKDQAKYAYDLKKETQRYEKLLLGCKNAA